MGERYLRNSYLPLPSIRTCKILKVKAISTKIKTHIRIKAKL
jgi:hypothetical protein